MTKIPIVESGPSERSCPNMTPGSFNQTRHANILVNPAAGRRKCGKLYPAVVDKLRDAGVKCDVTISRYPGELMEVASELAMQGCETVVACGMVGNDRVHLEQSLQTILRWVESNWPDMQVMDEKMELI